MSTCGQSLAALTERFKAAGIDSARLDARILVAHALGLEPMQVFTRPERELTPAEAEAIEALAQRRERREPVSHILGQREFWSLSFAVTADTLDPRPDTETLIQAVLDRIPNREAPVRLLDFGTGTGCILLTLLSELSKAKGIGVDQSVAALDVAKANARSLGLDTRAVFMPGNWGADLHGSFDVIVSNPPYIPEAEVDGLEPEVARWEPRSALAGGADGLDCYRALIPDAARLLAPGGILALEFGQGQEQAVATILAAHGLKTEEQRSDLGGIIRCIVAKRA